MKKIALLILVLISNIQLTNASEINGELIELAKVYRNFMFRNSATDYAFEKLEKINSSELQKTVAFIKETITTNNNLTTEKFLILPDEETLYQIYIIRRINWNLREENPKDNDKLILELRNKNVPRYELIDSYYSMLFSGIGNKNQPFDLSKIDFRIDNYELKNDTEKGIFFLKTMQFCGTTIWGYMNVVKPPNYKKALQYINNYPKFNGQQYYQYLDFGFEDFEMEIEKDKGIESYKHYYINKYYQTLLYHMMCLNQKKKYKKKRENLLLGSILKEKNYYKYSKNKETLESFFRTMKMD
jgi:hypothetical protein|tara:strand:- start:108 stop:1007 length:900 start_codon:yes stop_codon:yes gene_type:complete